MSKNNAVWMCKECGHITDIPNGVRPKMCCECEGSEFNAMPDLPDRQECAKCNHLPVCKDELRANNYGECPYFEGKVDSNRAHFDAVGR